MAVAAIGRDQARTGDTGKREPDTAGRAAAGAIAADADAVGGNPAVESQKASRSQMEGPAPVRARGGREPAPAPLTGGRGCVVRGAAAWSAETTAAAASVAATAGTGRKTHRSRTSACAIG